MTEITRSDFLMSLGLVGGALGLSSAQAAEWDQAAFEGMDRRKTKRHEARRSEKSHGLLRVDVDPSSQRAAHELLHRHVRHTDSVHTHDGSTLYVNCAAKDAEGLKARLELQLEAADLSAGMHHDNFAATSSITQNIASLEETAAADRAPE